jgi:undecaprenyl-diphosphatase
MKKNYKMIVYWLGLSLFILFLALTVAVALGLTDEFDDAVIRKIYYLRGEDSEPRGGFFWVNRIFTELGFVYVLIPACVVALIIKQGDLQSLFLSLGTLLVWLLNQAVKVMVGRERPDLIYHMMKETSASFPSGHAMTSAFFYFFLAYVIARGNWDKGWGKIACGLSFCAPFLIGLTRINLSVHYPTDVAAGVLLGGAFVCFGILILEWLEEKGYNGIKSLIDRKK